MPPVCSMLTLLTTRFTTERSMPSATILTPSPSWPLPLIEKFSSVSPSSFTPAATTISMTGPPPEICEMIFAPPRSMIPPCEEPVTLTMIGAVTA